MAELGQDPIVTGKGAGYRAASEALHRGAVEDDRQAANLRMLWSCGLAELIRTDFYELIALSPSARGTLLDAGCGTGVEIRNLARQAPELHCYGVDISSLRLDEAVRQAGPERASFHQAALEALPFPDASFDVITSHEVIEHVEDPAIVLRELARVLRPGGVCVIATPNGTSLWVEHLRQRLMRLSGRRGAPVGADHTRPVSFWRREFAHAGLVCERRIYDGAALEFLAYVAPARWMPVLTPLLEPLRIVPVVNLLLCDRVKFRLRKPGAAPTADAPFALACPVCHAGLALEEKAAICRNGHRFARGASSVVDFTVVAGPETQAAAPAPEPSAAPASPGWTRRVRRLALAAGCLAYLGFLGALLPLGFVVGRFHQPFAPRR